MEEKQTHITVYRLSRTLAEFKYYIIDYISERLNTPIPYSMFARAFWHEMTSNRVLRRFVVSAITRRIRYTLLRKKRND